MSVAQGSPEVPSPPGGLTTETQHLQGHDEIVWAVEVSGDRLLSASADKTIRIWDIASRRHVLLVFKKLGPRSGLGPAFRCKTWVDPGP